MSVSGPGHREGVWAMVHRTVEEQSRCFKRFSNGDVGRVSGQDPTNISIHALTPTADALTVTSCTVRSTAVCRGGFWGRTVALPLSLCESYRARRDAETLSESRERKMHMRKLFQARSPEEWLGRRGLYRGGTETVFQSLPPPRL